MSAETPTRRLWPLPQGVDTALTVPELRFLQELAAGKVVVEFGTHHGASAIAMALAGAKVVATVDPILGQKDGALPLYAAAATHGVTVGAPGSQIIPVPSISDDLHAPYVSWDGCFIDGDHANGQPDRDVLHALDLVRDGGWIALHDVSERFPEVLVAAEGLIEAGHEEIGRVGTLRAYRR